MTVADIAQRDADGYITIVDRKTDMVVTGGLNVYPREVENVIARVSDVRDVAVVGAPSAEWGECLHAFVVASDKDHINREAVITACREQLAAFKVPRSVSFICIRFSRRILGS